MRLITRLGLLLLCAILAPTMRAQSWSGAATNNAQMPSAFSFCFSNGWPFLSQDACLGWGGANTVKLTGGFNLSGQITSTLSTGTAPFSIASTTVVPNLNAALLNGATFAAPGAIGGTTPSSGAFTTISASGQFTSTVSTGTAPFSIASTTVVPNLNAQLHNGLTAPASAIVGISDTQTLTGKTFDTAGAGNVFKINGTQVSAVTGSGSAVLATSPALTTPTIGGETISAAPRSAFSGMALSLTSTGRVMQIPPDKAITVTSISYTVPPGGTVGLTCSTAPQVRVTDGTTLSSTLTLSNSSGSGQLTGLSVNYAAAADLRLEVAFNAIGCGTNWANVNFVVQYKMQ